MGLGSRTPGFCSRFLCCSSKDVAYPTLLLLLVALVCFICWDFWLSSADAVPCIWTAPDTLGLSFLLKDFLGSVMVSDAEELPFCHLELCWLGNESSSVIFQQVVTKQLFPSLLPVEGVRNPGGHQVPRSGFVGLLCSYARVLRCFMSTWWGRLFKPLYDSARELHPSVNCRWTRYTWLGGGRFRPESLPWWAWIGCPHFRQTSWLLICFLFFFFCFSQLNTGT